MPRLKIDEHEIDVAPGTTVLEAAAQVGIDIPHLCYLPGCRAETSCLACVVRINGAQRLVPSCATTVTDGMVVESESEPVRAARRTALELLLSDHAGDCMAPCQNVCPAHLDIPEMIRQIDAGDLQSAAVTARQALVLPATLGCICPQLCEKGCRRTHLDSAVAIGALHRHAADFDLASPAPWLPAKERASGKRVAIVGAGPAGLAAAWTLLQLGHECTLFDRHPEPGGALRYAIDPQVLPRAVLDAEIALIVQLGAEFRLGVCVGTDLTLQELRGHFDAVLLAVGPVDRAAADSLGIEFAEHGVRADHQTMTTGWPGVFCAGSAIVPLEFAVRAVAQGRAAARSIHDFLCGVPVHAPEHPFTTRLGKLNDHEFVRFFQGADPAPRQFAGTAELTAIDAHTEAHRCMSCDCASLHGCKLRRYAIAYHARPSRFRRPRRAFERITTHPLVTYEPGKCIACGLCVQIARRAAEPLGLAFIGRGFDVRIDVPFGGELRLALQTAAEQCAQACPTGAIQTKAMRSPD
jgi:NADPH-dependent glutamate synthase beta subunit-like oxidoreductase/ferredoxin